jgi:hypothetical protein
LDVDSDELKVYPSLLTVSIARDMDEPAFSAT